MSKNQQNKLRNETSFIKKHQFTDIEKILEGEFGERFVQYREKYYRTLNYDKGEGLPKFPLTVSFELVNRCNLNCVMCYTDHHKKNKTTASIDVLKNVLEECRENNLPAAVVGMGAEALLYKGIKDVITACRNSGIMDLFLGTNGTLLNSSVSEFLIQQKVARLEISLDAATPETYLKVRGKDQLLLIEKNIKNFLKIRKELKSSLPILRLCFCVQKINYKEREMFKRKWEGEGVDYIDFQNMVDFSDVGPAIENSKEWIPVDEKQMNKSEIHCSYPFNSLHVWSDGMVTPCCTYYGKALPLGNVKNDRLSNIWNGAKINKLRAELKSKKNLNPVCRSCLHKRETETFKIES